MRLNQIVIWNIAFARLEFQVGGWGRGIRCTASPHVLAPITAWPYARSQGFPATATQPALRHVGGFDVVAKQYTAAFEG